MVKLVLCNAKDDEEYSMFDVKNLTHPSRETDLFIDKLALQQGARLQDLQDGCKPLKGHHGHQAINRHRRCKRKRTRSASSGASRLLNCNAAS